MKNKDSLCPDCQSNLIPYLDKNNIGSTCPKCGWTVLASKIGVMGNDPTLYQLCIFNNKGDLNNIKILATILNKSFFETKKILENPYIITSKASDLIEIISQLKNNNLNYQINPPFIYI